MTATKKVKKVLRRHESISKESAKELLNLAKFLRRLPKSAFNLDSWIIRKAEDEDGDPIEVLGISCPLSIEKDVKEAKKKEEMCHTQCCVAGWQIVRSGLCMDDIANVYMSKRSKKSLGGASAVAQKQLGLSYDQAHSLFHGAYWPAQFRGRQNLYTPTNADAADRIEYLIKTGR